MLDIRSVATILDVVEEWEGTFSGDGIGYPTVWYRGQSDALWDLLPGALRDKFIKAAKVGSPWVSEESRPLMREITLNKLFFIHGASHFPLGSSPVDVYFFAQHHGMPTRLLDWTLNPLAALYFAASGEPNKDGALFALNPRFFIPDKRARTDLADILTIRHPLVSETVEFLLGETRDPPENPIVLPLFPDQRAGRIFQQSSCFTLHMPGVTDHTNTTLQQYRVAQDAKPVIIRQLRRLNITGSTLYGDLDNVAKELKSAFNC